MKQSQLNEVLTLVRRTGDKVVVMDNESEAVMVLMDLASYKKILNNSQAVENMSEAELMDKINRDIALWRAYNESENQELDFEDEFEEEEHDYLLQKKFREPEAKKTKKSFSIPASRFMAAQTAGYAQGLMKEGKEVSFDDEMEDMGAPETLNTFRSDEPLDDEMNGEDEKFYLEPIE